MDAIAAADVFGPGSGNGAMHSAVDVKSLHAKIGELTLENDLYERSYVKWRLHAQPPLKPLWNERDGRVLARSLWDR